MRTCSPYVALPFDSGRVRPELVGLLLHPISRSETWRRLVTLRTLLQDPPGFHSKDCWPDFWPAWRGQTQKPKNCHRSRLADVSQNAGTTRFKERQKK